MMFLNDNLIKVETQVENTLKKVERQYEEIIEDKKPALFKIEHKGSVCKDI